MPRLFDDIPFSDAPAAAALLKPFVDERFPALKGHLHQALGECADPQRALVGLNRYLEEVFSRPIALEMMATSLSYLRLLTTVFSQSHFLSNILLCHPEYATWLWDEAPLDRPRAREEMLRDLLGADAKDKNFLDLCRAMRRFRQREILRIAVRDIRHHAGIVSLTEDLSNLADTMLETAIIAARPELEARFGRPMWTPHGGEPTEAEFCILAMGKLGGRELNFSSDVDLLFLYSGEGQTQGGQTSTDNGDFFRRLGERVIQAMSEPMEGGGFIARVDMRLRPFGKSGPLASSLDTALEYYANYGRAWERQALIKARPCAGSPALGADFLERLRPFVYPRFFDDATLEDIRNVKAQTEAHIQRRGKAEHEVKHGPGGIRDIEFTVQMLQLLNGGRWPDLRTSNTLQAIRALGICDCLRSLEAASLASHYTFLRHIEHRLQIEDDRQCHSLPEDPAVLNDFARRLGFQNADAFMRVYRERALETRTILERFLASKGSGHLWIGDLLNPMSDAESSLEHLRLLGFEYPAQARKELLRLAVGDDNQPFLRHVHQQFSAIAPFLLDALSKTHHPDTVLARLAQVIAKIHAPGTLYELLKDNFSLCDCLILLVDNSEYLSRLVIRDPGLIELLGSTGRLETASTRDFLEQELDNLKKAADPHAALFRLRDGEMLRIAMRDLARGITVAQVGDELTLLAEVILDEVARQERARVAERYGECGAGFAVLALGKFGGREMGYGSDQDLVFLYDSDAPVPEGTSATEYFSALASGIIKRLKEPTEYGQLYEVDARLRPDGSKGPIAIGHHRFAQYFDEEAQSWERLALMKVRAVAGDPDFMAQMEDLAQDRAFSVCMNAATLEQMDNLRKKARAQSSPLDLKRWEGGISDVEFATRLLQRRHAAEWPELKRGDVLGALDIMLEYQLEDEEVCLTLRRMYLELRRILNRIRMMDGGKSVNLPEDELAQRELAARLNLAEDLRDYVDSRRQEVARIYRHILDHIAF